MTIETPRLLLTPASPGGDLDELVAVFNSNPRYLQATAGVTTYDRGDVERYLAAETGRENGRCLVIRRLRDGGLVGTAAPLVPHPEGYPWIGLLIIHGEHQGEGYGREAATAIKAALAAEGWRELRLGVLRANERALPFWRSAGYAIVEETQSSDGSPCWIIRKPIAAAAASS